MIFSPMKGFLFLKQDSRIFVKDLSFLIILTESCFLPQSHVVHCRTGHQVRQWFAAPTKMEPNCGSSNTHQNDSPESSHVANKEKPAENDVFINHAEIVWHQKRREWVGDQSKKLQRLPRKSVLSLTTNYEDMIFSTVPFQQPIPLTELVDLLVVMWQEEDQYD